MNGCVRDPVRDPVCDPVCDPAERIIFTLELAVVQGKLKIM